MNKNLYWPGGNPTLLIDDLFCRIPNSKFASMAEKYLDKGAEQVGFIQKSKKADLKVEMMGGELCINGIRSAAFWNFLKQKKTCSSIECSGTNQIFRCNIEYWVGVRIPKKNISKKIKGKITLIKMEGIAHFVVNAGLKKETMKKELRKFIKIYSSEVSNFPAIGLITLKENNINPLVYVKKTNSMIFETSCGSGAIAAFMANKKKIACLMQPSGSPIIIKETKNFFILQGAVKDISISLKNLK